ncbi:MAG: NADH-quinone oxidoreductase subunit I [Chloroflexi bacterium]|nr:NADH-quinone oxidoreductase subunit I [Chloroflexota bacterium]
MPTLERVSTKETRIGAGLGILKGMLVTFKHLFRAPFTVPYPEKRLPLPRRFRGYEFVWSRERCTVCLTCAKACPHGVIRIQSRLAPPESQWQAEKFEIDIGLCIFCGLCVESCPYDAIFMGTQFELANYQRGGLVRGIEKIQYNPATSRASDYSEHPPLEPGRLLLPKQ